MEFEAVIGLEVHVQLATRTKIFCSSLASFGAEPNTHIDPVTLGLPGALPVLNREVVERAVMMGLATNCEIRRFNRLARKHYFYPDLPKGYQISQFEEPICERGRLEIQVQGSTRTIGITRIHMEEDAGKNVHDAHAHASLVDLNRAGVPLLEIVSEPDIRSAAEASAYLRTLRQIARFLGVSDGNMEEGSLRCDANISLRPVGDLKYGTRTEIKNLNSFKNVERALEYEIARQYALLKNGTEIEQQTLLFDANNGSTSSMRGKEESADYRYFPDPDLPPLVVEESWVREIRRRMPKLPKEVHTDLVQDARLSDYDAEVLTAEPAYVDYFHQVVAVCGNKKAACNWITSELFGALNRAGREFSSQVMPAENLGSLVKLIDEEVISGKMAKSVFEEMFSSGASPLAIVEARGLRQITDESVIREAVQEVFDSHPSQLTEYLEGNQKVHGYFVGQVMKKTQGTANPRLVNEVIKNEIRKRRTG